MVKYTYLLTYLLGFSLTSFHLAEAALFASLWLYTLGCAVVQKYHFAINLYSFCNQPVLFAPHENVNKPWNNNRIVHANERNQNKSKSKSRNIQFDHAVYCSFQPINNAMVSLKDDFTV